MSYRGRFAPSPTGPLHPGSLVAALASWLDARAHGGAWLVRIEDLDPPREVPGAAQDMLATLPRLGLESDEAVWFQSERSAAYEQAFERLRAAGLVYGCACSRKAIEDAVAQRTGWPSGVYPGTCREWPPAPEDVRAWRLCVTDEPIAFTDRHAGRYEQHVAREAGDFVLRRADGLWAYQLAVVVDDAAQGITDVVRGADLLDNTPRQIVVQLALGLATPRYLHVRLVVDAAGEKLSKQTGAAPIDATAPLAELERAAAHLRLPRVGADSVSSFLRVATILWAQRCKAADRMIQGVSPDG